MLSLQIDGFCVPIYKRVLTFDAKDKKQIYIFVEFTAFS